MGQILSILILTMNLFLSLRKNHDKRCVAFAIYNKQILKDSQLFAAPVKTLCGSVLANSSYYG